ncbi:MAG: type VI secretion system contractile sheath small subunit [bacterium]|nr:type VI secretion system contractile sheath small subunit [bacterium]
MSKDNSQKFIGRNRPPRVQIEYDVELYGAEKVVQLPFVMSVLSDLSGDSNEGKQKFEERKILEVDIDNFDDRMAAIKPSLQYRVPNTLTGEGEISVDIELESMEDFEPGNVVKKIEPLNKLLNARKELSNLLSYMDGKTDAEDLILKVMNDHELLKSLTQAEKKSEDK